jgi:glutaredoxin 3
MAEVTIYTSALCGFCHRAKGLLRDKGVAFEEISVDMKPDVRAAMRERAGGVNTVPQIFIDETHVGGCDELFALESRGELDRMLSA